MMPQHTATISTRTKIITIASKLRHVPVQDALDGAAAAASTGSQPTQHFNLDSSAQAIQVAHINTLVRRLPERLKGKCIA
jgi:hypothetical protein